MRRFLSFAATLLFLLLVSFALSFLVNGPDGLHESKRIRIVSSIIAAFWLWHCRFKERIVIIWTVLTAGYLSAVFIKRLDQMSVYHEEMIAAFAAGSLAFSLICLLEEAASLPARPALRRLTAGFARIVSIAVIMPPCLMWGYYAVSGHVLTADILLTLFQTNPDEAMAYLSSQNLWIWGVSVLALLIISMSSAFWFIRTRSTPPAVQSICFPILLTAAAWVILLPKTGPFYPFQMVKTSKETLRSFTDYRASKAEREQHLAALQNLHIQDGAGGVYILVIGESATRDHMHAYGYERETTPWLDDFAREKGSILFSHAYSNHTHTVPSLTYALSEKNQYNTIPLKDAYSILETAKAAGYQTYWISNQQKYGAWDTPVAEMASTADHEVWLNRNVGLQTRTLYYDEQLISRLPSLADSENAFIIIHLMGSHGSYNDRSPSSFSHLTGADKTIDAYDTSILYTDYVLKGIYETACQYPRFNGLIYFSDHGDEPHIGHDSTKFTWTMAHIPLFIHVSPRYRNAFAGRYRALEQNQHVYWTNDLLYDLLIDIMGIEGVAKEPAMDLASPDYAMPPDMLTTLHGQKHISDDPILTTNNL